MKPLVQKQINTVFVHASDLKVSVLWYAELLGHPVNEKDIVKPVYTFLLNKTTSLTIDAGPEETPKDFSPLPYPLFNFHTNDIEDSLKAAEEKGLSIASGLVEFDDFSFFTLYDPDNNQVMICSG
ncbi:VOC family protein [Halobacillus sp. Marseille-Q1614]|uniref:VOC family protein n=1 Tax=Halobacillus sp. Marseille-Q1614 TaxID=2709134 RepID=UPI00156E57B9|nr:VOC family protein [Halobacillus sp. Marseille-Q1614]